ncbi:hypothetical protein Pla111_24380 [Botrimarina hoheduenensis]|uniref:Uncharacterized protein n=1 Tax=Botrimarina hoheduenensis TaxID=2528000 RepID=A0A5C5VZG0_9BACT|nr:hypothetical protein Pla111_24380 [Botrimarina hoheduenensis]
MCEPNSVARRWLNDFSWRYLARVRANRRFAFAGLVVMAIVPCAIAATYRAPAKLAEQMRLLDARQQREHYPE